jgi:hypothetical protein
MSKLSLVFVAMCLSACSSPRADAQAAPVAIQVPSIEKQGFAALNEAALRADLAYVASDALEGRMSLQPGDETAIGWTWISSARPV